MQTLGFCYAVLKRSLESLPPKNQLLLVYVKIQIKASIQLQGSGLHATDKNRKEHLLLALFWVVTMATVLCMRTQAERLPTLELDGQPLQDPEMPCDQGPVSQKDCSNYLSCVSLSPKD